MLSKKDQEQLLKDLKYSDADIAEMLVDAEVALKPRTGVHIMTDSELTATKDRVKTGHEAAFKEIWGKELNTTYELGLSVTDAKDAVKVIEAMKVKIIKDAGVTPDAQITELKASLKKLQDETIPGIERERDTFKGKLSEREMVDKYKQHLDPNRNDVLTESEWIARLRSVGTIATDDAGIEGIKGADGAFIKDASEKTVPAKDHYAKLFKDSANWLKAAPPADPEKKKTFGQKGVPSGKKFADNSAILAEVEKQVGTTKGRDAQRLYNQLIAENKV